MIKLGHSIAWAVVVLVCVAGLPALSVASDDAEQWLREADQYIAAGKFTAARTAYENAIARGADIQPARARNLGQAYLNSVPPDLAEAVSWLRVALEHDSVDARTRALLAQALARAGSHDEAAAQYRELLREHPDTTSYVLGLAGALRQAGKSDVALQLLGSTVDKFPGLDMVRLEYARQLNDAKQFGAAKTQYELVLRQEPDNLGAQLGIAKATAAQGDQEGALQMYDRILQRHPGLYDALVGKASSLLSMGRAAEAGPLLQAANQSHPENTEVRNTPRSVISGPTSATNPSANGQAVKRVPSSSSSAARRRSQAMAGPAVADAGAVAAAPPPVCVPADNWWTRAGLGIYHLDPTTLKIPLKLPLGILAAIAFMALVKRAVRSLAQRRDMAGHASPRRPASRRVSAPTTSRKPADDITPSAANGVGFDRRDRTLSGVRVLMAGKEASVVELQRRYLVAAGAEVTPVAKWEDVLAWLAHNDPDVILLNALTDDRWSGPRIYLWMQSHRPELAHKTILVLSGSDEVIWEFRRSSGARCIFHPVRGTELVAAITQAIADAPQNAGAAASATAD